MVPIVDTMVMAAGAAELVAVGPIFVAVAAAAIAAAAWLGRGTAEEIRRTAARDWERRTGATPALSHGRLAA